MHNEPSTSATNKDVEGMETQKEHKCCTCISVINEVDDGWVFLDGDMIVISSHEEAEGNGWVVILQ
jgi:hypothetical protein